MNARSKESSRTATSARSSGQAAGAAPARRAGTLAWLVLFGALVAGAGHGLLLFAGLRIAAGPASEIDTAAGPAEPSGAEAPALGFFGVLWEAGRNGLGRAALAWLLVTPLLALGALAGRRRLEASPLAWPLALASSTATLAAYFHYLVFVVRAY